MFVSDFESFKECESLVGVSLFDEVAQQPEKQAQTAIVKLSCYYTYTRPWASHSTYLHMLLN